MNNEPSWLLTTVTWNKSSAFNNDTGTTDSAAIYVFTPAPYVAKQVLAFFLVFIGGIGFFAFCGKSQEKIQYRHTLLHRI